MLLHRYSDNEIWNQMKEMENLRSKLNHLLTLDSGAASAPTFPLLNTWLSEEGAVVTAEIPGLDSNDIDISVVNDTLTIKGERKPEALSEGQTCHRQERGSGHFGRSVQLPFQIEADKVNATFSKGVLKIELPRAESEKPRKISIKTA